MMNAEDSSLATTKSKLNKPMRLAHAIHSGGFYGAEKVLLDLAREQMARPDLDPCLVALLDAGCRSNEIADRTERLGLKVIRLQAKPGLTWKGLDAYATTLKSEGIDLVHSHGYKATAFHLCGRWLGLHRLPILVTAHGYPKSSGNWKATLYRWMDILFLGAAERVVAVSREMGDYLRSRNPVCKLSTIPNGISSDLALQGTHPLGAEASAPIIGTAGRLVAMKNQALLIRAYAEVRKIRPCKLLILGDGPLRSSLEALWRELIPDEPVGLLPFQSDVLEWIADMDIFALPSNDGEGLPMALLEAGLLERAVVCTRSGGMSEVIRDGETGRLIDVGDLPALVKALADLLNRPEDGLAYGRALRRRVLENHDIRVTHVRYLEEYAHILAAA